MKKNDIIFIFLMVLSNIFGWVVIYFAVDDEETKIELKQDKQIQDSIKSVLDSTYIFNHSQIVTDEEKTN